MNYQQVFESKPFHMSRIGEGYKLSNIKPVLHSSNDVKRMLEENARAKLISQIVGTADEHLARDFAASFRSAPRDTDPPQLMTSHKTCPYRRRRTTVPTYPSVVQSLRWNPYVQMSSAENSHTDLIEEQPKFRCRCESCTVKNCPSRVSSAGTLKPVVFKDNIMTFSDRFTMTPRLNDACCGACTPIAATPKVSDVCVPPDIAVRDTETVTHFPMMYVNQGCAPIPILKRDDFSHPTSTYSHCGHSGHVPIGFRQEAVRDTDVVDDYCDPIKPKSLKNFFKFKKKPTFEHPQCIPEYGRTIIYNEGISDTVANNFPIPPIRVPSPINIKRKTSGVSVKTMARGCFDTEDGIPYAHRSESRYHNSCKKPNIKPLYHFSDVDEIRHVVESPKVARKMFTSRSVRPYRSPTISLPRKVLTSEADIESYIDKPPIDATFGRRKKSKK